MTFTFPRFLFRVMFAIWLLAACNAHPPVTASPTATSLPTSVVMPSPTASPLPSATHIPTSTKTPFPTPAVTREPLEPGAAYAGLACPELPARQEILPENFDRLQQVATFGEGSINDLAFSPDGKFLAVASTLGIKIISIATYTVTGFTPFQSEIVTEAFLPEGEVLILGMEDGTIILYQVADGAILREVATGKDRVDLLALSPDGRFIASVSGGAMSVVIWRVSDGGLERVVDVFNDITSLAFSPDGEQLAVGFEGDYRGRISIWQVSDGKLIHTILESWRWLFGLAFSPDGEYLIAIERAGTVHHIRTADWTFSELIPRSQGTIMDIYSIGGILGVTDATSIYIWTVMGRKLSPPISPECLQGEVKTFAISPNAQVVAVGSTDGELQIIQPADNAVLFRTENPTSDIRGLAFSPKGNILASVSVDNTLQLWCISNGKKLRTVKGSQDAYNVVFSPDKELWAASTESGVEVSRVKDGSPYYLIPSNTNYGIPQFAFSLDWSLMATNNYDDEIRLWRTADGKLIRSIYALDTAAINSSPDGQFLAYGQCTHLSEMIDAGCDKGQFSLWNLNNEKNLWSVDKLVEAIRFSPDGSLAAGHLKLELFNMTDGSVQKFLADPKFGKLIDIDYSPGGNIMFARTIALPDGGTFWYVYTADGKTIQDEEILAGVEVFSFSGDSSILATAAESLYGGVIRVWGVK